MSSHALAYAAPILWAVGEGEVDEGLPVRVGHDVGAGALPEGLDVQPGARRAIRSFVV